MTRVAVVADIHANLAALEAVLEDIGRARADLIVCLGDVVGYHAEPSETVALVRRTCAIVVAGNHDRDVVAADARPGTGSPARLVQRWTRARLSPAELEWLARLPALARADRFAAAHGAWLSEIYVAGYVTSTMLEENLEAVAARPAFPRVAFSGHTHVPMVGWLREGCVEHRPCPGRPLAWPAEARAVLINPGSVGQPRDGDPRAAWALVDPEARLVEQRRVRYDLGRTLAALARAGLPAELGARLREGR